MRFPHRFSRFLGAGTDPLRQLGQAADLDPNAPAPKKPSDTVDMVLIGKFINSSGWPLQRVAIGYKYIGGGAPPALPGCALWVFDYQTEQWYRMPATFTLTLNQIQISDVVALMESSPRNQAALVTPTAGSLEAWLAVPNPGGPPPDGEYVFSTGPDLSANP